MLEEVKSELSIDGNERDVEVQRLIDAAIADLALSGVAADKAQNTMDPLIKQAIVTYCRAHFDYYDRSAEWLMKSYEMLKAHLSLAGDYNSYIVTFTVTSEGAPVRGAKVVAGGIAKVTNSKGEAVFMLPATGADLDYTVTADGYQEYAGSVYVSGSKAVAVTLDRA
jgi:hypothetical protein